MDWGSNRKQTHIQAPKGSGGVGLLIKCDLYKLYNVKVIDHAYEGIIGVQFANKFSDFKLIVYSMYLPPENSPWGRDATSFFSHLLTQVYLHCETDAIFLCGDLNSRIGSIQENNDCFDNIPHQKSIEKTCNQHGKSFLEFLNNSCCCILNGRFGEESEEYTFYSTRGHSVVDYICIPLDNFTLCQNFQITKWTDLVERYNRNHRLGERSKIPDHYVLTFDLKVYSQLQTDNQRDSQNKKRFNFRRIPADFLSSHTAITAINSIIARIERCRETQTQIDALYKEFRETMLRELSKKIPTYDWSARTRKRLRPHKPYWNEELTELWRHMREMEKKFLKCDPK